MEYEKRELDRKALQEEILRKCRKKTEFLAPRDKTEDEEYEAEDLHEEKDVFLMKTNEIIAEEKELPFEDILADKRREYTAKEEFIYSMYNDILPVLVVEWDGYFLRKKPFVKKFDKDDTEAIEKSEEIDDKSDDSFIKEEEKNKISISSWKLSLPDEFADITFYNKNSYRGRISRKMMEGEGTYRWHNGICYKGQFECNKIQGRGFLEWNNNCWYEGDFVEGLRHGKGLMVDRENNRMYLGRWHMGYRHKK